MLAGNPHGVSDDLLVLAHGFDGDMIAGLIRTGLATKHGETNTGQDYGCGAECSRSRRLIDSGGHDRPVFATRQSPSNDSDTPRKS
jgi:hypothetical protein